MSSVRLLLFLSCGLLAGSQGFAENENGGGDGYDGRSAWESLEDFENENVEVQMYGGRLVRGRLADVTETFVLVDRKETQDRVGRDQVHRVTSVQASTRKRNTFRGLSIGLGTVGLISLWYARQGDVIFTFPGVAAVATIGGGVGSAIGYLTSSPESRTIIYEPPQSVARHEQP